MANARIEIVRRISAIIAVVLGIAWKGLAETVENVRGSQRENSKLVDIYYDLNDSDGGTYYVEVEIVGRTSDVNASSFSGDVGEGISPGQNRRIVWDAGVDWPDNKGDVKAVVTAIRGGKPNKVQLWEGGPYWADRNIGADAPWEDGLYFWWGDTIGYKRVGNAWVASDGSSSSISFSRDDNLPTVNKSVETLQSEGWITTDGVLVSRHDAAHVKWGGGWRMPTDQELSNLIDKCDWTRTSLNGVWGYEIRGRGDYASNSIFMPTVDTDYGSKYGVYWSSELKLDGNRYWLARQLHFSLSYERWMLNGVRYDEGVVRPVRGIAK